jgi:chromosome partitioning protein
MKDAAAYLNLPVAKTTVVLRQIYADAPGQAALVWNLGAKGREAGEEIRSLFRELIPDRKRAKRKPARKRQQKARR